nr:surface lipoprotein assembly modifier [uncultured Albidiferax sp.]
MHPSAQSYARRLARQLLCALLPLACAGVRAQDSCAPAELQAQDDESRYDTAHCLIERKAYRQAIAILSELVAKDDWPVYKAELGRAYLGAQEFELARQQFIQSLNANPPENARLLLQRYLGMAEQQQVQTKEWMATASLSRIWDSNLNTGPISAAITVYGLPFTLDTGSMPQADQGSRAAIAALQVHPLRDAFEWRSSANLESTHYDHFSRYNTQQASVETGPGLHYSDRLVFNLPLVAGLTWLGSAVYTDFKGLSPQLRYSSGALGTGTLSAQLLRTRYADAPWMSSSSTSLTAAWRNNFAAQWSAEASLQRTLERANDASFSNQRSSATLGVQGTLFNLLRVAAETSLTSARYSAAESWASAPRSDTRRNVSASISKDLPGGYYLALSWSRSTIGSNLEIYSTQRRQTQIQLSKTF